MNISEREKLSNTVHALELNLKDAFDKVTKMNSGFDDKFHQILKSELREIKLNANSNDSDVRILGLSMKSFQAPDNVPEPSFGETVAEFREYIHRRVTCDEWKSRTFFEFSDYLDLIWQCIKSADFTLSFASIIERLAYDELYKDYKKCERRLANDYNKHFNAIENHILLKKIEKNGVELVNLIELKETLETRIKEDRNTSDKKIEDILKQRGRERWKATFEDMWDQYKEV